VLLCDDQSELRDAIILLLGNFPRFRVVGQATDGVSCLRRIADSRPDIVIMDVSLPGGGVDLVRSARAGHPDMHIVMFSGHDEASMQADMLAAGADCYVITTGRLKPLRGHGQPVGGGPRTGRSGRTSHRPASVSGW